MTILSPQFWLFLIKKFLGMQPQSLASRRDALKIKEKAEKLVSVASAVAITSFLPLRNKFDCLRDAKSSDWDFFVTIGTTFLGLYQLVGLEDFTLHGFNFENRKTTDEQFLACIMVMTPLGEKCRDGERFYQDCRAFVLQQYSQFKPDEHYQFLIPDLVGKWIFWNIFKRSPESDIEYQAAMSIGRMGAGAVVNHWQFKT